VSRATLALVAHSLRRLRAVVIGVGLLLAAFQFLLTQVAGYLLGRSAFGELATLIPDFVRTAAGPSTFAFMSFAGIVSFGYFHPVVIATLVGMIITIATEPATEVETRFVDLTLSRPLARYSVITRTLAVLAVAGGAVLGLMMAGTWTGLTCCTPADAPRPPGRLIGSLALSLAAELVCWAGIALAFAAAARRRAVALTAAGGLALAAYLLDYLGRIWEPARRISVLSPFHYFEPTLLVVGAPLSGWNLAVLVGAGAAASVAAYVLFAHRDI
jgi:ABC-2 type transport system permease protein